MDYLVDTSVLIRFVTPDDPFHEAIVRTVTTFQLGGRRLFYNSQGLRETWAVLTRPAAVNGYGMSVSSAASAIQATRETFILAEDTPSVVDAWMEIVTTHRVSGKQVHDANHVATMMVHGIGGVLTLDPGDFLRYDQISVVTPE